MKKAAVMVDDWKLPVFRRRLEKAGFTYKDGGAPMVGITNLMVDYEEDQLAALATVVTESQAECAKGPLKS